MVDSTESSSPLTAAVAAFVRLLEAGRSVEAIERFYAEDVCVFENRELARAGRDVCAAHEREQLSKQPAPPTFKVRRSAVNEADQIAFVECVVRFHSPEGRPLRLEQVAVQQWHRGLIAEERFYYEGVVDEGD